MTTRKKTRTFKSGFVSIIGRPNAGKSTLLNALVGTKIAIVANKPQTTRTNVQGVWTSNEAQIVLVDTPGIHKTDTMFNRRMMADVKAALEERDVLVYVADASRSFDEEESRALNLIRQAETPIVLALNKIDRLRSKSLLLPVIEQYQSNFPFAAIVPVSARRDDGTDELRKAIVARLPEGEAFFAEDYLTDQPERFLAAELIREKCIRSTHNEVPHSLAVLVDQWKETRKLTRISATILCERDGQKAILIGTKGTMLKRIGTEARTEMESLFDRKIFLELFVKVQPGWRENPAILSELDWRTMMDSRNNEE